MRSQFESLLSALLVSLHFLMGVESLRKIGDYFNDIDMSRVENHRLNLQPREVENVEERLGCILACSGKNWCYSVNFKHTPEEDGKFVCELLTGNRINNSALFTNNSSFTHYGIKDPCSATPCLNNGKCVLLPDSINFQCECAGLFTGKLCEKEIDFPECASYTTLSDASRNVNSPQTTKICDSGLVKKWYRLEGDAGTVIPSACPSKRICNTDATGWVSGMHPTVEEGIVTRKVCYHWSTKCCNWSNDIRILNCGSYYIYELIRPPVCSLRYCGE
ncbi:uromodulin [Nematostella vectensis]|uniref:uromodulin n=1 Tax=Nematostella vectensis TaxID=45351 RepID=UPI001390321D|nr:uromodulin [Nematostella vectensis]